MSRVAIIDYGSGNLRSAAKAFERCGANVVVTADPGEASAADRIVLPGVGAFADCRDGLAALPGMVEALTRSVIEDGKPFLGICVGMQLMATFGLEHGRTQGLGWIDGEVRAIAPSDTALKVPHMGWNELSFVDSPAFANGHDVLQDLNKSVAPHAYFVHSFHFQPDDGAHLLAKADYGGDIVAIIGRDNLIGTQFHPEKSQAVGLKFIENFLAWRP